MFDTDKPITKAADDLLNRATFAEHLAQTLINYSVPEGFVIGLYGKWGSGKTSVLNMITERIEKTERTEQEKKDLKENAPIVLRFNPWLCSDPKQLVSQFFKRLSTEIKSKKPMMTSIVNFINDYGDAFELARAIPVIGNVIATAGKVASKKANDYMESRNNDLQQIKNEISAELLKAKIKIIVTIDDIDRLSNEEIVSVFQLVKSLADFPYTIYLLSFDRNIVVRALAEVQKGDGAEYLEKVVQVPFELPAYDENSIYHIFFNKMDAILTNIPYNQRSKDDWSALFHNGLKHYLSSVRAIIRFINTFTLKYELLKNETYFVDLIGLTCLQVFEPEVFSRLRLYKKQLCGSPKYISDNNGAEEIQTGYNVIIKGISENKKSAVYGILVSLFPQLSALKYNRDYYTREYDYHEALNKGCISCPECFDRYFSLMLEPSSISQAYIKYLICNASETELLQGIEELNLDKKITLFVNHIEAFFQNNQENADCSQRAELVFLCLIRKWQTFEEYKNMNFIPVQYYYEPDKIAEVLLLKIKNLERYPIILNIFNDNKVNLLTIALLLNKFKNECGRFSNSNIENSNKLLTPKDITNLENIFLNRVIVELKNKTILDNRNAIFIISLLEQIDPGKSKQVINEIMSSDLLLTKFISAIVLIGNVIQRTGIISYRVWHVNEDSINKYVDVNVAYGKIINFTNSNEFKKLEKEILINIGAFLISVENDEKMINRYGDIRLEAIEKRLKEIGIDINADSPDKP